MQPTYIDSNCNPYPILESETIQEVSNHPVHIQNVDDGHLLPTALIPFCEFGGSISAIGAKIDQLDVPVCNSFRPKILRDQLCYTVDPNKYKDNIKIQRDTLKLSLYLNYNEDRQVSSLQENLNSSASDFSIIIETIGNIWKSLSFLHFSNFLEPLKLSIGKEYNLNNVKEIKVTEDFLSLDKDATKCQNEEQYNECTTRLYMDALMSQCHCLPFSIRQKGKVKILPSIVDINPKII